MTTAILILAERIPRRRPKKVTSQRSEKKARRRHFSVLCRFYVRYRGQTITIAKQNRTISASWHARKPKPHLIFSEWCIFSVMSLKTWMTHWKLKRDWMGLHVCCAGMCCPLSVESWPDNFCYVNLAGLEISKSFQRDHSWPSNSRNWWTPRLAEIAT